MFIIIVIFLLIVIVLVYYLSTNKNSSNSFHNLENNYTTNYEDDSTNNSSVSYTFKTSVSSSLTSHYKEPNPEGYHFTGVDSNIFDRGINGYVNYALYTVKGKNSSTNRINTVYVEAVSEEDAINESRLQKPLIDPFTININPHVSPSDAQLKYANDVGIKLCDSLCLIDVSTLLSRYEEEDYNSPPLSVALYADSLGIKFSKFIGERSLFSILGNYNTLEIKSFFFIYCVCRYVFKCPNLDINSIKNSSFFNNFVNDNISNTLFINSLKRYGDFPVWTSFADCRTNAYKIAKEYIKEHNFAPY